LIVHDEDDDEVPFVRGEALANAWPGARLHVTRGLGHRRILRDPDVVSHVCAFIDGHVTVS
jgi:pimeloyl-ACP methyl ester carboxylesterase